jgi:hypothetical protein
MASRVQLMKQKGLIAPPKWLPQNVHYEVCLLRLPSNELK